MADEDKSSPFNESSIFDWMKTASDMWLNMATNNAVQFRFRV